MGLEIFLFIYHSGYTRLVCLLLRKVQPASYPRKFTSSIFLGAFVIHHGLITSLICDQYTP